MCLFTAQHWKSNKLHLVPGCCGSTLNSKKRSTKLTFNKVTLKSVELLYILQKKTINSGEIEIEFEFLNFGLFLNASLKQQVTATSIGLYIQPKERQKNRENAKNAPSEIVTTHCD